MRYLALDIGDKRTGLAAGCDASPIVTPVGAMHFPRASEDWLAQLQVHLQPHQPDVILVGWPLNVDGSAGPAAHARQQDARLIARHTGLPVYLVDERHSSEHADAAMAQTGLTHKQKKQRRDALAACAILAHYQAHPDQAMPVTQDAP